MFNLIDYIHILLVILCISTFCVTLISIQWSIKIQLCKIREKRSSVQDNASKTSAGKKSKTLPK